MRSRMVLLALAITVLAGGCALKTGKQLEEAAIDHYVKAQILLDGGDLDAALLELARAIEADPDLATAHASMADIYRKRENHTQALASYERAVAANAFNFRNHYNCGYLHQMMADAAGALETVRHHLRRAVELYRRAVTLNGKDYDAALNLGACYLRLEQYEQAERYCKQAVTLDADKPHAYTNLGAIYDRQGRYYSAISMYRQSLERNDAQPDVMMNLAAVYVRQAKFATAIRDYKLAANMSPDSAAPLERLGYCHYFKREYTVAIEYYQAALAKDFHSAEARRGLGVVYMTQHLLDKGNTDLRDKALAQWHASLEINPDQPNLAKLVEKYSPKYAAPPL